MTENCDLHIFLWKLLSAWGLKINQENSICTEIFQQPQAQKNKEKRIKIFYAKK